MELQWQEVKERNTQRSPRVTVRPQYISVTQSAMRMLLNGEMRCAIRFHTAEDDHNRYLAIVRVNESDTGARRMQRGYNQIASPDIAVQLGTCGSTTLISVQTIHSHPAIVATFPKGETP